MENEEKVLSETLTLADQMKTWYSPCSCPPKGLKNKKVWNWSVKTKCLKLLFWTLTLRENCRLGLTKNFPRLYWCVDCLIPRLIYLVHAGCTQALGSASSQLFPDQSYLLCISTVCGVKFRDQGKKWQWSKVYEHAWPYNEYGALLMAVLNFGGQGVSGGKSWSCPAVKN